MAARTFSAVPTGTVDLVMTTLGVRMFLPMVVATASTCCRSAEPSSPEGVPTAMNTTRERSTAAPTSVLNASRPSAWLRSIISSRPGS
jgi:hypothetical protein